MHDKKSFIDRFRSKNAPPPRPANGAKPVVTVHPRIRKLLGAPFEFVEDVCRSTEGRTALVVALHLYRRVMICNSLTVTLPSDELAALKVTRQDKQKALIRLQQAGLVKLARVKGRTTQVTLMWRTG